MQYAVRVENLDTAVMAPIIAFGKELNKEFATWFAPTLNDRGNGLHLFTPVHGRGFTVAHDSLKSQILHPCMIHKPVNLFLW